MPALDENKGSGPFLALASTVIFLILSLMASLILILFLIILLFPTLYAALRGAPLALTSKKELALIIKEGKIKQSDVFYDLGSGTGRVMIEVARKTGCKVVGIELSPVLYLISFLNLKLHKIKKFQLKYRDFFRVNFKKADVVYVFLMPKSLEKLSPKLKRDLKPGARVISYIFPIKKWQPEKIIKKENRPAIYFYLIK